MTAKKKDFGFFMKRFRIYLALFMAAILFFEFPFTSEASVVTGEFFILNVSSSTVYLPLKAMPFDSTNDSRAIPVSYNGSSTLSFSVSQNANKSYASGAVIFPVTFKFTSSLTGDKVIAWWGCQASIQNVSAPDGITVSMSNLKHTTTSCSFDLRVDLEDVFFYLIPHISVTFDLSAQILMSQSYLNVGSCRVTATSSVGSISSQGGRFYDYVYEYGPNIWLHTILTAISSKLTSLDTSVNTQGQNIVNRIQTLLVNMNTNHNFINDSIKNSSKSEIDAANTNSQKEIDAANKNSQNEINNANKNADDIMHSYDSSGQQSDNDRFDQSQKELQDTEDSLFSSALTGFGSLNLDDYSFGKFTAMLEAFSFVSGFIQSLYVKMGDFGLIVTIGLVVMIATKVLGLYRFSTGGDP